MDTNLKQYNIYVGFPGEYIDENTEYMYTVLCSNDEEANEIAYMESRNQYDTYEGSRYVKSYDDFVNILLKEQGLSDKDVPKEILLDALDMYNVARNSTFDYYAKLTSMDTISQDNLILNYSFEDDYDICETSSSGD